MLNTLFTTLLPIFYPGPAASLIAVENSVDPDQMALSEVSRSEHDTVFYRRYTSILV